MNGPKWISPLFYFASLYDGFLGLLFLVVPAYIYQFFGVTPPNHFGYVRFPAALLMVFALMFFAIAKSPKRNRNLIPYGFLLKIAYCAVTVAYWEAENLPDMWKPFTIVDAVMAVLFFWAYVKLIPQETAAKNTVND